MTTRVRIIRVAARYTTPPRGGNTCVRDPGGRVGGPGGRFGCAGLRRELALQEPEPEEPELEARAPDCGEVARVVGAEPLGLGLPCPCGLASGGRY